MFPYSILHYLKKTMHVLQFGLLTPFLLWANSNLLTTAKQAERLFHEKLYGDAIPFYSQLFALTSDPELKTQWALRLATCHLEEGQPQTTLALLSPLETPLYRHYRLFLMSLAYRQLGNPLQALNLFTQCSLSPPDHAKDLVALEQGCQLMQMHNYEKAKQCFKKISCQNTSPLLYELAQLQLAKIFLIHHQFDEALRALSDCSFSSHFLHFEEVYLKGWALLGLKREAQAAACFETLFPLTAHSGLSIPVLHTTWSEGVPQLLQKATKLTEGCINGLIISYLRQALLLASNQVNTDQLIPLFDKTDRALKQLIQHAPNENSYLLLSDFYLIKAKCLSDAHAYEQAQQLLARSELFSSQEGIRQALLKRAAAAPSYEERRRLYEELSNHFDDPPDFCAKVRFLKGLNDFEEGLRCQKQQTFPPIKQPFERAIDAFQQACQYGQQKSLAFNLKYLALAYAHLPEATQMMQAWQVLNRLINDPALLACFEHPEEIYCLSGWIALRLGNQEILQQARSLLQEQQTKSECSPFWHERYLKLEGMMCLQLGEWQKADLIFERLLQNECDFSSHGEAWFWRAYSADQRHDLSLRKEYLQHAYTQDPQSPYAPLAYFQLYSYREYMQGNRKALKHLQAMPLLFPLHPLSISAYYLIGLNHKKDRLSEEGQIVKRKDWIAAIDAFQLAESTFETLIKKNLIPISDLPYFTHIRYEAQLERAQANLAIAQKSTAGKRQIYLEYAEEVFQQLIHDFTNPETFAYRILIQPQAPYPKIWAEAEFQLAKTYEAKKHWKQAEEILNVSLDHYHRAQIDKSYGLMRVWYTKGKLAKQQSAQEMALQYFLEAEKAAHEVVGIDPHEKLNLWIQQSLCYQALHQLDPAMRLLSRVINEDVISPLRIKAMFLRAEIYELQGRPELAIKQLEATARKGGEWSQKAKEKLEKIYGYSIIPANNSR